MTKSRGIKAPRLHWTDAEDALLRDLYPDVPRADAAALLGRTLSSTYQAAYRLGLKKSTAFFGSSASGRITVGAQSLSVINSRFKPGAMPRNKGTHFTAGGRSAETRFKKGTMSGAAQHNYVPIGSLRISKDGYLECKFTDDPTLFPARRWVAVHRQVWEAAHGPIPAKHIIVFRPGMRSAVLGQITADRLECISRAEHAWRNSPRSKSPELAKLVQLKGAITRQVNRISREHKERQSA